MEGFNHDEDVLIGIVHGKRRSGCTGYLAMSHEGHAAVVSGADGDTVLVEDGAEVVGVGEFGGEGEDGGFSGGLADDFEPFDVLYGLGGGVEE